MDKITHEVRLKNWKAIIEQCHARPKGQTAKQWLADHDINEKCYYYWQRQVRKEAFEQIKQPLLPVTQQTDHVTFAEISIAPALVSMDSIEPTFRADAMIRSGNIMIGLSNSVSESLLNRIIEGIVHAV